MFSKSFVVYDDVVSSEAAYVASYLSEEEPSAGAALFDVFYFLLLSSAVLSWEVVDLPYASSLSLEV